MNTATATVATITLKIHRTVRLINVAVQIYSVAISRTQTRCAPECRITIVLAVCTTLPGGKGYTAAFECWIDRCGWIANGTAWTGVRIITGLYCGIHRFNCEYK